MTGVSGGCLCGRVSYQTSADPQAVIACHCSNCRKQSGAAFSFNLLFKAGDYTQTGETKVYPDIGDSGKHVFRHFCGDCGSPINSQAELMPGFVIVKAGTADAPGGWIPAIEVYCDSALPWVLPLPGVKRVAKGV
jgi:hypothetical protein